MKVEVGTKFGMRGDLMVVRRSARTGDIESVWEKKNTITFAGPEAVIALLAPNIALGASVQEQSQIKSMRFGTSNLAPEVSQTALASEASVAGTPVRVELVDANRLIGSGTVEFIATLNSGTGNGVTYREAGLFTRGTADDPVVTTGAAMFARQVFPEQPKTSAVELEFRWRITITV